MCGSTNAVREKDSGREGSVAITWVVSVGVAPGRTARSSVPGRASMPARTWSASGTCASEGGTVSSSR